MRRILYTIFLALITLNTISLANMHTPAKDITYDTAVFPNPSDTTVQSAIDYLAAHSAAAGVNWGDIHGTISNQTDLQSAFNAKQNTITTGTTAQYIRGDLSLGTSPTNLNQFTNGPGYITGITWGQITGTLSSQTDLQNALNAKQGTLTFGNFTETTSSILTITGGTGAIIGSGLTVQVKQAGTSQSGYLSSTDWNTFNNKQAAGSYLTSVSSNAPLSGSGTSGSHLVISQSTTSTDGYLSSTDWNTFNGKGSGSVTSVTAGSGLSGGTITGTGTISLASLGVQSSNVNWANINGIGPINGGGINWTNFPPSGFMKFNGQNSPTADTNTYITGNQNISLSGDITGSGTTSISTTLATVNSNVGSFTNATITVNGKGLITAASSGGASSGTVTNVATSGGLTGGPITTTGTISIDTLGVQSSNINWTDINGLSPIKSGGINWSSLSGNIQKEGMNWTSFPASGFMKFNSSSSPSADLNTYTVTSRTINTTAPITGGGDLSADRTIAMAAATTSVNGYLTSADWNTFNGKQANLSLVAGTYTDGKGCSYASSGTLLNCNNTYLTANQNISLTGPVTGSGTTSIATTIGANQVSSSNINWSNINGLAPLNSGGVNWNDVNRVGPINKIAINWTDFPVSGFAKWNGQSAPTADTNTYLTGNQNISLSGDISGSGTTSITTTLATVNSNVGTFQGITVNGKGLVTAASNQNYLTGNQTITLSGPVTGSGATSITTAIGSNQVQSSNINWTNINGLSPINTGGINWNTIINSEIQRAAINWTSLNKDVTATGINWSTLSGNINKEGINWTSFPTTGFMKFNTNSAPTADTNTYLTGNQTVTLSGDVTGSGATSITTTLANIPTATPAVGTILHTNISAPSSPASGKDSIYTDSTDLRLHDKNASGVIGTTVVADTGASNNFLTAISTAGAISKAQPSFSNLSGSVAASQMPALTGDVTTAAGAVATTIGSLKVQTGMINWTSVVNSEVQRAGVNWASLNSDIKTTGVNWNSINGVGTLMTGSINWTDLVNGKEFGNGLNWNDINGLAKLNTGAVNWASINSVASINKAGINWTNFVASGLMTFAGSSAPTATTAPSGTIVGTSDTQTLTNKRITRRDTTTTQSATPTINTDNTDRAHITGLAQAITSFTTNLSGTPNPGDTLAIDITDNGTARALAWGTSFEASGTVALPTTTVISTRLDVFFVWNEVTTKWRIVSVS